ncbi:hypothetical protein [Halostella litorea]|uniref:hypothetical protein n=1 Tax=Halostella litorea TaxID=2528831 RepID=UPI0013874DD8|nr:hypothetical protein [Halostella litorea]
MDLADKATLFLYVAVGIGFAVLVLLLVSRIDVWPFLSAVDPPSATLRPLASLR